MNTRLSQKAQSIIEYTTVIVLVVAGLILMRPYVIRAVNAHMKSWQDNVKDSMKETLHEAPPPAPPECGDGACTIPETIASCCADCGSGCGDGTCCAATEDNTSCPQDCSVCGDGSCTGGETVSTCCGDCTTCGDGCCCTGNTVCSAVGTPINADAGCTADCTQLIICGDGTCQASESVATCPQDCCPPLCGNGVCNSSCNENSTCPGDCLPVVNCSAHWDDCCSYPQCFHLWYHECNPSAPTWFGWGCFPRSSFPQYSPPSNPGPFGCECNIDYAGDTNCASNNCQWWVPGSCPCGASNPSCSCSSTCIPNSWPGAPCFLNCTEPPCCSSDPDCPYGAGCCS